MIYYSPYSSSALGTSKIDIGSTAFASVLASATVYSGTTTYTKGNIVSNQGALWVYINTTNASGVAPPTLPTLSNAYWDFVGSQGTFTWIAYADSSDGVTNFTTGVAGTRKYIGIAANKTTDVESSTPSDYTWSKFVGDSGSSPIYVAVNKPSVSVPTDSDGNNAVYTNSTDTRISVVEGQTTVTYDGVGTSYANGVGTWKILSTNTVTTLSGVSITGTAGQFSCSASSVTLAIGTPVVISGTLGGTGSITGYTNPKTYYIIATNGSTTFTLSATLGGTAITTTAGTPTGLTYSITTITTGTVGLGGGGAYATYTTASSMNADTAFIEYTIQGTNGSGVTFTGIKVTQTFTKIKGAVIDTVAPGVPANLSLTSSITTTTGGDIQAKLSASWTANTEADLSYYEVQIKEAAGSFISYNAPSNSYEWLVKPNTEYSVQIRAVDKNDNRSAYCTAVVHTTTKDTVKPAVPTSLAGTAAIKTIFLTWTNPADTDLAQIQIFESTANSIPTTPSYTVNAKPSASGGFSRSGVNTGTSYYYWIKSVDSSGNVSATAAGPLVITPVAVANADITVGTINADRITASTLTGDRFDTATSLPGTITVGSTGVSIATVQSNAAIGATDPASRINSGSTTIDPGKILISGTTTLSSWKNGTDATKIEGGSIAANTISANALQIGMRGVDITGIIFQCSIDGTTSASTNIVTWTTGTIIYTNDSGTIATAAITAGSATWSTGTVYLYWTKGATSISSTTASGTAYGVNNIVLATYTGGFGLVVNYGRTIIDGTQITTGSITGTQIKANSVSATQIDSKNLTIKDNDGNIIFGVSNNLDFSRVGGSTKPADNATVGATFGANISGQITQTNASTYIANGAIGTVQINDAAITNAKITNLSVDTFKIAGDTIDQTNLSKNAAITLDSSVPSDVTIPSGSATTELAVKNNVYVAGGSSKQLTTVESSFTGVSPCSFTLDLTRRYVKAIGYNKAAIELTGTPFINYDSSGLNPGVSSVNITATVYNVTSPVYTWYVNNVKQSSTSNILTFTSPAVATKLPASILVIVQDGSNIVIKATYTIYGLVANSTAITVIPDKQGAIIPNTKGSAVATNTIINSSTVANYLAAPTSGTVTYAYGAYGFVIASGVGALSVGDAISFSSSAAGFTANTVYYVYSVYTYYAGTVLLQLTTTYANAINQVSSSIIYPSTTGVVSLPIVSSFTIAPNTPLAENTQISFKGTTWTGGPVIDTIYYAKNVTGTSMQLSSTSGGTPISFSTGAGALTMYYYPSGAYSVDYTHTDTGIKVYKGTTLLNYNASLTADTWKIASTTVNQGKLSGITAGTVTTGASSVSIADVTYSGANQGVTYHEIEYAIQVKNGANLESYSYIYPIYHSILGDFTDSISSGQRTMSSWYVNGSYTANSTSYIELQGGDPYSVGTDLPAGTRVYTTSGTFVGTVSYTGMTYDIDGYPAGGYIVFTSNIATTLYYEYLYTGEDVLSSWTSVDTKNVFSTTQASSTITSRHSTSLIDTTDTGYYDYRLVLKSTSSGAGSAKQTVLALQEVKKIT